MPIDTEAETSVAWLSQFTDADRLVARQLLQTIDYVGADQFRNGMIELIGGIADEAGAPIALYAERRLPVPRNAPHGLYKWAHCKVRRAEGDAPQPAAPERNNKPEIGSEGVVANIISSLQRVDPHTFLVHPSMQALREARPRRFVLVTDFVGSGDRAKHFLDAAWKVPTIRSWASYGLMSFDVATYSTSVAGREAVERHATRPRFHVVSGCPTIALLAQPLRSQLISLSEDYCPVPTNTRMTPLGYGSTGALIAFSHGVPNNAPLLLHKRTRHWSPFFAARTTDASMRVSDSEDKNLDDRLVMLREQQLKAAQRLKGLDLVTRQTVLVLAALKRRPRRVDAVSARTGLTISDVELAIRRAKRSGFIGDDLRPTQKAYAEFAYLRKSLRRPRTLPRGDDSFYFPTMLRPPTRRFR